MTDPIVTIGVPGGRIALLLDEETALALADDLSSDDLGRTELLRAVAEAYPDEAPDA